MNIPFPPIPNAPVEVGTIPSLFSSNEIEKILNDLEPLSYENAYVQDPKTSKQNWVEDDWRKSRLKWIPQDEKFSWVYYKIMENIVRINSNAWKYDITHFHGMAQYTEYPSDIKGNYNWHLDIGTEDICFRKLSVSLQLSDSSSYKGGDLEIYKGGDDVIKADRELGTAIFFPSFILHRVKPVTEGIRKSLVFWIGGPAFK